VGWDFTMMSDVVMWCAGDRQRGRWKK